MSSTTRLPAAERRRQLLDVALGVFAREGYHEASMNDVAEAAVRAMHKKQLYVVMPALGRFYWYFKRLTPTGFFKAVGKDFARRVKQAEGSGG